MILRYCLGWSNPLFFPWQRPVVDNNASNHFLGPVFLYYSTWLFVSSKGYVTVCWTSPPKNDFPPVMGMNFAFFINLRQRIRFYLRKFSNCFRWHYESFLFTIFSIALQRLQLLILHVVALTCWWLGYFWFVCLCKSQGAFCLS